VNGKQAEVLYAGGYPDAVDRYQVNFRVPDGTAAGLASVQLTSAWIPAPEVKIAVQEGGGINADGDLLLPPGLTNSGAGPFLENGNRPLAGSRGAAVRCASRDGLVGRFAAGAVRIPDRISGAHHYCGATGRAARQTRQVLLVLGRK